MAWLGAGFVGLDALFALLYAAVPGCVLHTRPGSLYDAFFFSVEATATVGYASMAPATLYGHLVASLEIDENGNARGDLRLISEVGSPGPAATAPVPAT